MSPIYPDPTSLSYSCPICGQANEAHFFKSTPEWECACSCCGTFKYTNAVKEKFDIHKSKDAVKLHSALFYFLKIINRSSEVPIFFSDQDISIDANTSNTKNINNVLALYPHSFSDRINKVMQLLNTKIVNISTSFIYTQDAPYRKSNIHENYFLPTENKAEESNGIITILQDLKYLRQIRSSPETFTFDIQGWEKIDALQRQTKSQTAFIAMSFDKSLSTTEHSIKEAIESVGYIPIIIKDKEHNNSIVEEITYEIKRAAFVITDLTKQNNGAYYEAGLAKGFGKEVIFTCNENDFNNIHFDTKQINTIKWSDTDMDKFKTDLSNRIKFTIGEYSE